MIKIRSLKTKKIYYDFSKVAAFVSPYKKKDTKYAHCNIHSSKWNFFVSAHELIQDSKNQKICNGTAYNYIYK